MPILENAANVGERGIVFGDAGNDTITGGPNGDVLSGGEGNDSISGLVGILCAATDFLHLRRAAYETIQTVTL